jgi:hypothetical protein
VRKTDFVLFPAGKKDERLGPKEEMFSIIVKDKQLAFPVNKFNDDIILNTKIDDLNVFIFFDKKNNVYGAFEKQSDEPMTLLKNNGDILIKSEATNKIWDLEGGM